MPFGQEDVSNRGAAEGPGICKELIGSTGFRLLTCCLTEL